MTEHRITIAPGPFGVGYDVTVKPPPAGEPLDREFPTYQQARGWAVGLKMVRGGAIDDHCSEATE